MKKQWSDKPEPSDIYATLSRACGRKPCVALPGSSKCNLNFSRQKISNPTSFTHPAPSSLSHGTLSPPPAVTSPLARRYLAPRPPLPRSSPAVTPAIASLRSAMHPRLHARLREVGVPSEFHVLPGAGHGGKAFDTPEVRAKIRAFLARSL